MSNVKPILFEADEFGHAIVACPECGFKRRVNVSKYRGVDKIFSIKCICQANVVCRFQHPIPETLAVPSFEGRERHSEPPVLNVRNDGLVRIKCPGCSSETLSNVSRFKERKDEYTVKCACGQEHSFRLRYPDDAARTAVDSAREAALKASNQSPDQPAPPPAPEKADPLVFCPTPDGNCLVKCPNCNTEKPMPQSMVKDSQKIFAVSCKCGMNFSFRISTAPPPRPAPSPVPRSAQNSAHVRDNIDTLISVTSSGEDLMRAIEGGEPLLLRETFRPDPIDEVDMQQAETSQLLDLLRESGKEMPEVEAEAVPDEEDIPEVQAELATEDEDLPEVDLSGHDDDHDIPTEAVEGYMPEVEAEEVLPDINHAIVDEGGYESGTERAREEEAPPPVTPEQATDRVYEQGEPIIFFPNSKGITRIICPECHFEKQVNAESFRRIQGPVGIQCKCGLQFTCRIEFRQVYRKETMLAGEYIKQRDSEPGRFMIRNVSLGGAGLRIIGPHTVHPGDVLFIRFTLDNALGTEIRKTLKVVHVSGQDLGGTFTDKNFSQDLGYYLMA